MTVDWLNVALSLGSGAGGALLLDLWWKPRYARHRASRLLLAEIQENRDFIKARLPELDDRVRVWRDLLLPTVALDAAQDDLGSLPIELTQAIVRVYHRYAKVLRSYELQVEAFYKTEGPAPPAEHLTESFMASRMALRMQMAWALDESRQAIALLEVEAAKSLVPLRRARLLPPSVG